MSSIKIKVVHFHNGTRGGVLSVIRNLLLYRQHNEVENHVIYTINKDQVKDFQLLHLIGATSEQVFYYSPCWNFYYTCRQLSKLLPDAQAVLVAHDWLELGMISNLGLQNPVVQFLHGHYDYYFNLSLKHEKAIDAFVCVASAIKEQLKTILPQRQDYIFYQRFPVPDVQQKLLPGPVQKIVFIGRCEKGKGYNLLPMIAEKLVQKEKQFEWHIIGEGSKLKENQNIWPVSATVYFYGVTSNEEVLEMIPSFDCLILPSIAEGMPLTVIESMKAGLIPVVNDLQGGLQEIIINGETGYRIENNSVDAYVEKLANLQENKYLAKKMALSASCLARDWFSGVKNTEAIETIFFQIAMRQERKPMQNIYGSRLDKKFVPNIITTVIRRIATKKALK
jgi:glycosyltransferase involved in cell wall biosynthesis